MPDLLVNIDVPDLERGVAFYTAALGLRVSRRFDQGFVELRGASSLIYLLEKKAGTATAPASGTFRHYDRHWTPVHFDVVVPDLAVALAEATAAGATLEGAVLEAPYGKLAMFADPFGNGFCLIEFNERGYDALADISATVTDSDAG